MSGNLRAVLFGEQARPSIHNPGRVPDDAEFASRSNAPP
jgi:hypothetical protein